jgi:PiT family inorganic phosphate transporter
MGQHISTIAVGVVIAVGGIGSAKRVAETMSRKITPMNHGQGFAANLITGIVVIAASCLGMPASTTHVSCGALFGIGLVTRQGHIGTIMKIVGAWITTLPLGAALGAASFWLIAAL